MKASLQQRIHRGVDELHRLLGEKAALIEQLIVDAGHPSYVDLITEATAATLPPGASLPENWEEYPPDTYEVNLAIEEEWNRLCVLYFEDGLRGQDLLKAFQQGRSPLPCLRGEKICKP